jgi:GT2 family glycosyltransferase
MGPAISVVIPTFNRARHVQEAVGSVFAQTFTDYEVIVVDDGSTDGTEQALKEFREQSNFYYTFQPNQGRSTARNRGIDLSKGDFLLFLDSDDLLLRDALGDLYSCAEVTPSASMIVGKTEFVDEHGRMLSSLSPSIKGSGRMDGYLSLIRERFALLPGTFLIRRQDLLKIGVFDPKTEPCEDYDFSLRVALNADVSCIDKPVVQHRMHSTNTPETDIFSGNLKVCRKHLELIESSSLPANVKNSGKATWMLRMADSYYGLGQNLQALRHYLKALSLQPKRFSDVWIHRQIVASMIPHRLKEWLRPLRSTNQEAR